MLNVETGDVKEKNTERVDDNTDPACVICIHTDQTCCTMKLVYIRTNEIDNVNKLRQQEITVPCQGQ